MAQLEPKQYPNVFIIDNGWVEYLKKESKVKKHCDPNQKSYHGDATVKIILGSQIPEENIYLINVYENSYITGEPKVEKQASLRRVLQLAKAGDIMLMNMELYRTPYNLPITTDPASVELVNELAKQGVICIFPAGNSCIDLADRIENPTNYILVGAKNYLKYEVGNNKRDENGKDILIHTSNFTTKGNMKYNTLCDDCSKYFGINQSSAAAAVATVEVIDDILNKKINVGDGTDNTDSIEKYISKFNNETTVLENKQEIKTTNYKGTEFEITNHMLEKWRKELSISYNTANKDKDKNNIKALANLLNPINRNLFPYPVKLKVFDRGVGDKINFTRTVKTQKLRDIVTRFKDGQLEYTNAKGEKVTLGDNTKYLALKLCFGVDANGDILLIASGYIPEDFDINETHKQENSGNVKPIDEKNFFYVSKDAYYLNYEKKPDEKGPDLSAYEITPNQKKYFIKEFQSYFKKTNTYGLTIGLNVLDGLLEHYYDDDELQLMIVSDSRNIDKEQEFGVLIVDENGNKPICIIKDRVINQADGPTCPPVPPCEE